MPDSRRLEDDIVVVRKAAAVATKSRQARSECLLTSDPSIVQYLIVISNYYICATVSSN